MPGRSLRHPIRGDHRYPKPSRRPKRAPRRLPGRQPRIRPRRNVSVGAVVGSPEEIPSRPTLRLTIVGLIVLVLFGVMVLRLWNLQVVNHKKYAAEVSVNQVRTVQVPAPRGEIVDRQGAVLVGNEALSEIVLSRAEAAAHPAIIGQVAALVGETPQQVEAALNDNQYSPYQPVPVLLNAPTTTVEFLQEHQAEYPGVSVEQVTQRSYPLGGSLATPVLGYVSPINAAELAGHKGQGYTAQSLYGQAGVENEYQPYLRGTAGVQQLEVNAQGEVVGTLSQTQAVQGDTVVLNLDAGLQQAVTTALTQDMAQDRQTPDPTTHLLPTANTGAAVVLDAHTGDVLAMVSLPTYSLEEWAGGMSDANYAALSAGCNSSASDTSACPLLDYALDGEYTPGSTFKLNTATAALDDGLISAGTLVNDTGTFTVPDCTEGCVFHDDEASDSGEVNVQEALTKSDDYFFYQLGYEFYQPSSVAKWGPTPIQDVAHDYGLGSPTGIDLPGEAAGQVDSAALRAEQHKENPTAFPNTYYGVGDNIEMAFGQGETLVTPIQQAVAYATFANGGTRYQPEVAAAIVTPTGKVVESFPPKVTGHVSLPPSTYQPMMAGFSGVVNSPSGTAYGTFQADAHFPEDSFPVAGKTGTADVNSGEPDSWFVGFGPTNVPASEPEYVVAVVVDHGGYGAQAAAPAVASIFNYLYANPVQPVVLPSALAPPSLSPPTTVPPVGTPTTTTTTAPPGGTSSTTASPTTTAVAQATAVGKAGRATGARTSSKISGRGPPTSVGKT